MAESANRIGNFIETLIYLLLECKCRVLVVGVGLSILIFLILTAQCKAESETEFNFTRAFQKYPDRMLYLSQDDPETKLLLEQFKPRIFISPKSYVPVNFYRDYLPRCNVRRKGVRRKVIYHAVNKNILQKIQDDSNLYLDFIPSSKQALTWTTEMVHPTLYGRIYKDTFTFNEQKLDLLFLKYSFVIPYSGLIAKISWWKKLGSGIIGNRRGWHELDIHGSIHVVLEESTKLPIGVLLAQHNHHCVYMRDIDFQWPVDNRVMVSIAEFSNEPYLVQPEQDSFYKPAAGNPMNVEFIFGRKKKVPFTGGYDHVITPEDGATEVEADIELLPLDDPLYTATISLGDRKRIFLFWESWFVAGPPGIDYYTLPQLKNLADLITFWYADPADDKFFRLVKENTKSFPDFSIEPILKHQKERVSNILFPLVEKIR